MDFHLKKKKSLNQELCSRVSGLVRSSLQALHILFGVCVLLISALKAKGMSKVQIVTEHIQR